MQLAATDQADVLKAAIPAVTGLFGVMVGGCLQMLAAGSAARKQREYRLQDDKAERDRATTKLAADRSYFRAILARHLEAYAYECAQVMWKNGSAEDDEALATAPPKFPEWPEVEWELLGANEMMKARDIALRVQFQRAAAADNVHYSAGTPFEARSYYEDAAARLGLEAWNLSQQMRAEAGVDPFKFPTDGPNFAESLATHVREQDEREQKYKEQQAARRAAREAAGEAPDPFD